MRPITTQHQDANCRMQYRIRYDDIRLFDPKRCLQHFYFTVGIRDAIATAHHSGSSVDEWMWSVTCVTELSELEKISCPKSCGLQIGTSLASMTGVVRSQGNEWPCNCWQPSEIQILRLGHGVEKHTLIKRSCQHTQCKLQRFSCAKFDVLIFQVSSVPLSTWIGKYQMNESATSLPQPLKN